MKNPLRKRYKRELKSEFGKYAIIFLFMTLFIGIVSGFLITDNSVKKSYDDGFAKYNIEDGHIAFKTKPQKSLLDEIAKANKLTFYEMYYKNESIDNTTIHLRIYPDREIVNTECIMSGEMPTYENEIALDRMFAENNDIKIGDSISVKGVKYTVTALIALPDYSSLFENNSDMMFDAINFGVGITTKSGFEKINNAHLSYNYAWKYNESITDEADENARSEAFIESLEDIIKEYDETIIQQQVDEIYIKGKDCAEKLEKQFETASKDIEAKLKNAGEKAGKKAISDLTSEEMLDVICKKSGKTQEEIFGKVVTDLNIDLLKLTKIDVPSVGSEELMSSFLKTTGMTEKQLFTLAIKVADLTPIEKAEVLLASDKLGTICSKSGMSEAELFSKVIDAAGINLTEIMKTSASDIKDVDMNEIINLTGKTPEQLMSAVMKAAGVTENEVAEDLLNKALEKKGTTILALTAKELGTTEKALNEMMTAFEEAETLTADIDDFSDVPKIDLDEIESKDDFDSGIDFSFDKIYEILDKVSATGIYDVSEIKATVDRMKGITDFTPDEKNFAEVTDYCPRYLNQAICFTGEDMGGDKAMITLFMYIVIIILAFVFAVTTSNTIQKEAGVIGTLRASGYGKGELIRHYLVMPIAVTLAGATLGNILGYTVFESFFIKVYFNSYSLCTYETLLNADAFLTTTVVPIIIMIVINLLLLTLKMRTPPLNFLRGETTQKKKKHTVRLSNKSSFMNRYRTRILLQNIPSYLILFFGIFFGGAICIFGSMFGPLCEDYKNLVTQEQICNYQYVLNEEKEINDPNAEKFCIESLDTMVEEYITDSVTIYGVENSGKYVKQDIPDGQVLISNGIAEKFKLGKGDELTLKEKYSNKTYTFKIAGIYEYSGVLSVFMPRDNFNSTFDESQEHFSGYFSNRELTQLSSDDIAMSVTSQDLTKMATQLEQSMGEMMSIFKVFGIVIFVLLMFLLTKQIIDKNSQSISMAKILGFSDREIGGLYLAITSVVVFASLLLSIPLIDAALHWAFTDYLYVIMSGYIPYIISNSCYVFMIIAGTVSYILVCLLMIFKIRKVQKGEVLKNQML